MSQFQLRPLVPLSVTFNIDVVEGLEEIPRALNRLFDGTNQGKLVVKL